MKISKLQIKCLFGIREFAWDGKNIEISGKKGVGKSSIVDAIRLALTNKSGREYIITQGEKEGEVLIETDSGARVNRKLRTEKADYKSIKQSGEKDEKTEAFLREIFTELQLNPVEFAHMTTEEQNRIILDLIKFDCDLNWIKAQFEEIPPEVDYDQNILNVLHDIQSENGYYFKTRQEMNREIRNKQAFITEVAEALPKDYDVATWQSANLAEIYKKIETIRNNNSWIEKARTAVNSRDGKVRSFQADYEIDKGAIEKETTTTRTSLEKQITEMENRIKAMKKDLATLEEKKADKLELAKKTFQSKVAEFEGEVKQHIKKAKEELVDFTELQERAEVTEKMKGFINEYNRMVDLQRDVEQLQAQTEDLTTKIDKARALPGEILATANIPIVGLTIENGIPLIQGRPISNLSSGELLELCVDVAVNREGSLKLLLIDGIERLSEEDRDKMYKKLKEKGVQFISTRVTDENALNVIEL